MAAGVAAAILSIVVGILSAVMSSLIGSLSEPVVADTQLKPSNIPLERVVLGYPTQMVLYTPPKAHLVTLLPGRYTGGCDICLEGYLRGGPVIRPLLSEQPPPPL